MSNIAGYAGVNKALIYYYFPSKQSILDYIIDSFFNEIVHMGIAFIHEKISELIHKGKLDIMNDRFHFQNEETMLKYKNDWFAYYRKILKYLLAKKDILRIILAESLRNGDQKNALFRFFTMIESNDENPIFKVLYELDPDIYYSKEAVFRKFFFAMMPMISFIVYHDIYKQASGFDDDTMCSAYMNALEALYAENFSGQDILITPPSAEADEQLNISCEGVVGVGHYADANCQQFSL